MAKLEIQSQNNPELSESAALVQSALETRGIETPMQPNEITKEEKKNALNIICVKF